MTLSSLGWYSLVSSFVGCFQCYSDFQPRHRSQRATTRNVRRFVVIVSSDVTAWRANPRYSIDDPSPQLHKFISRSVPHIGVGSIVSPRHCSYKAGQTHDLILRCDCTRLKPSCYGRQGDINPLSGVLRGDCLQSPICRRILHGNA